MQPLVHSLRYLAYKTYYTQQKYYLTEQKENNLK